MRQAPGRVRFVGDTSDPWVEWLADGLPGMVDRHDCRGPLGRFEGSTGAPWVVHRSVLTTGDLAWLRGAHDAGRAADVLLVAGPHARFHQLQRCQGWVDQIVSEASARVAASGWLLEKWGGRRSPRIGLPGPAVAVSSRTRELSAMLVQALKDGGRSAEPAEGPLALARQRVIVWEAEVLETGWDRELIEASRVGKRVVALLGLADRELVSRAYEAGAETVMELPCELGDLVREVERALDREPRHDVGRRELGGPHAMTKRVGTGGPSTYDVARPRRGG